MIPHASANATKKNTTAEGKANPNKMIVGIGQSKHSCKVTTVRTEQQACGNRHESNLARVHADAAQGREAAAQQAENDGDGKQGRCGLGRALDVVWDDKPRVSGIYTRHTIIIRARGSMGNTGRVGNTNKRTR